MSDPVTNVEIEDVLSSIRKLVSDDPGPSEKGLSATAPAPDRLVLTPDFRVQDDPASDAKAESDEGDLYVEPVPEDTVQLAKEDAVEDDAVALFDEADDALDFDAELSEEFVQNPSSEPEVDDDEAPMIEDAPSEQPESDIVGIMAANDPLASRIAELETAVAQQSESWDPDGIDESDENTPAALESNVSDLWETVSPEDIPASVPSEDPLLEAEEDPEDEDRPEDAAPDAKNDTFEAFVTEDDAMLDEDALRDMVSELVRQELQGALGARITRNVRKLVRREIHRIMDSKDFE
mgnify:FL=1